MEWALRGMSAVELGGRPAQIEELDDDATEDDSP